MKVMMKRMSRPINLVDRQRIEWYKQGVVVGVVDEGVEHPKQKQKVESLEPQTNYK